MPGYIEDRWMTKLPDPKTGKRRRKETYGIGLRYRVGGIPGVKSESFKGLQDAKDWLASAQVDSRRGDYIDPRLGQMTLREYIETIWWPGRSDPIGTASAMKSKVWNHVLPHLGGMPIATIDAEHLRLWVAKLRAHPLSESTIEVIWIHLTSIFKTAVGKRINRNPCTEMADERPSGGGSTKARAWSRDEVEGLRKSLVEDWYRILVDLGVRAGLRQGEAFGLSPNDLDDNEMVIHLRRQVQFDPSKPFFKLPKGNKERDIPLSRGLYEAIHAHKERYAPVAVELPWRGPGNNGRDALALPLLVTTTGGRPIHAGSFNTRSWKPALAATGLIPERESKDDRWEPSRELMFHRCRHTYASVQLGAGEDVVSLSHWMGHASPDITFKTYAHFMPDNGRRGRTAVDEWLAA
jgi:integrase